MKNLDLKELLIQKINALYDIENQLVKALAKLAKTASDQNLKKGFRDHLAETRMHATRLEQAGKILGVKTKKLKVEAIRGLIKDGEWIIKNVKPMEACDANLARAAQYVEHYEMAGYMGAIAWASELGEAKVVSLLRQTLKEEQKADQKLDKVGTKLDKKII